MTAADHLPITTENLPIPRGDIVALLYGGAFDPPHRAHLELPAMVRERLGADVLVYVPAAAAPLKAGPVADAGDRVAMLQAGLAGRRRTAICTLEIDRAAEGASFTVETLREIRRRRPAATLRLLIGADQARQFHRWREAAEVARLAEPAVMLRPPVDDPEQLLDEIAAHWSATEAARWRGRLVAVPAIEASSTRVRELLATDPCCAELGELLPEAVRRVIIRRGLYGCSPPSVG